MGFTRSSLVSAVALVSLATLGLAKPTLISRLHSSVTIEDDHHVDVAWNETYHNFDDRDDSELSCGVLSLRGGTGTKWCNGQIKASDRLGLPTAYFWDAATFGMWTTKKRKLPADIQVHGQNAGGPKFTCDHILELSLVKKVLSQPNGVCDQYKALAATDPDGALAKLKAIKEVANLSGNLIYFTSAAEGSKTINTQQFVKGAGKEATSTPQNPDMKFMAMFQYLKATSSASAKMAIQLDAAIAQNFPEAGKKAEISVKGIWAAYLVYTRRYYTKEYEKAENLQRAANCGGPSVPKTRSLTRRSLLGFSAMPLTSLERRARGAAKSGPNAPAAPACPMKNAPKKTPVKKSATKQKAPPARKPRPASRQPPAKRPNPRKQVAKRPATRSRRAPGKQAVRKRTTPKKVPRKVPKPTRRPKGKARPRKRR